MVRLFKSIVVVDGKWVWDSWILKHRAEGKTRQGGSEQTVLTEMEVKTGRGGTFANQKVKHSHFFFFFCLQPQLCIKSHVLNLNMCLFVLCKARLRLPKSSQHYKNARAMIVSQNNSHEIGLKVQRANRVCCLRACPASRVYKPIYETLTLTPVPLVSECVCVSSWLMVV